MCYIDSCAKKYVTMVEINKDFIKKFQAEKKKKTLKSFLTSMHLKSSHYW